MLRYWHIKNNCNIDINLNRGSLLNCYKSILDEISYLENRMDNYANDQSVVIGICNYINNMFGKCLYYREKTYNGMKISKSILS
jgi:hypothetical protein